MSKGWRTGTSAASWALRRAGRYREADELLEKRAKEGDAEALLSIYSLNYEGSLCGRLYSGDCFIPLYKAKAAGHPVAEARRGGEMSHALVAQSLHAQLMVCIGGYPHALAKAILEECDPEAMWMLATRFPTANNSDHLIKELAHVDHHPMAAYCCAEKGFTLALDRAKSRRAEDVACLCTKVMLLEIAVAQGHISAAYLLALVCFDEGIPIVLQDATRGANLLVRILLHVNGNYAMEWLATFKKRLNRVEQQQHCEFYVYGKHWRELPKAETMFPFHHSSALAERHPRRIYDSSRAACQAAAATIAGLLRYRCYKQPDMARLLGRMVWESREREASQWWAAVAKKNKE